MSEEPGGVAGGAVRHGEPSGAAEGTRVTLDGQNGSTNAEVYRSDGTWVATFPSHEIADAVTRFVHAVADVVLVVR